MKHNTIRYLALLLALVLSLGLLTGCSAEDETSTTGATTPSTAESTEETEPEGGILGENGKWLQVDYETPGVLAEEAAPVNSKTLVINDLSLEMPFLTSLLTDNGWSFYSEASGQQLVSANTQASVMGFTLYLNETAYLDLSTVRNDSGAEKPILECYVEKLIIDLDFESTEDFDFILPGGITKDSTAADILAVYGPVVDNESFDYVQVGNTMLYYADHVETELSFYFGFREDGTLKSVTISF